MVLKWTNACSLSETTSSMWGTPTTRRRRLPKVREGAGKAWGSHAGGMRNGNRTRDKVTRMGCAREQNT